MTISISDPFYVLTYFCIQSKNHIASWIGFHNKPTLLALKPWKNVAFYKAMQLIETNKKNFDMIVIYLANTITNLISTLANYKPSFQKKILDAGIQDVSTSISIVHDLIERSPDGDVMMVMMMKVTNICKHEIVDTRA